MKGYGYKRRALNYGEGSGSRSKNKGQRFNDETSIVQSAAFPLLELPDHILCDILLRLPLKSMGRSRCVCRMLSRLMKEPYFAKVHLDRAPLISAILILQQRWYRRDIEFFQFNLCNSLMPSCSSDDQSNDRKVRRGRRASPYSSYFKNDHNGVEWSLHQTLQHPRRSSPEFNLCTNENFIVVGSCNGLLCMCFDMRTGPIYSVCNPLVNERMKLPPLYANRRFYTYTSFSGFGYCPRTKQYKVFRLMYLSYGDSVRLVAKIHTLGSDSWRQIEGALLPRIRPFDPWLNGFLHWITTSNRPSELICSFDLEMETFRTVPRPEQFTLEYLEQVYWMNVGVMKDCLCICSIYTDSLFEAWVMRDYGVRESWTKEFTIDMKYYCLQMTDLDPIRFLRNGDMWFVSAQSTLVSYCPKTKTFKELRSIGTWQTQATLHDLSFISLKNVVGVNPSQVKVMRVVGENWFYLKI